MGLRVVRAINKFCLEDGTRYWAVPSVIAGGAEKRLVDGSAMKLQGQVIHVQHEV